MKANTAPSKTGILTARFRGLKIAGEFSNNVLPGAFDIRLAPMPGASHLYHLHLEGSPRPFNRQGCTLQVAKEKARLLFVEQITEWRPADQG